MRDAGRHSGVAGFAELVQLFRVQGGATAGMGVFHGLVRLAQDGDDVVGPGLRAAGAELHDRPASPDHVSPTFLDVGQP